MLRYHSYRNITYSKQAYTRIRTSPRCHPRTQFARCNRRYLCDQQQEVSLATATMDDLHRMGYVKVVNMLMSPLDPSDLGKTTPLHLAAAHGYTNVLKYMTENTNLDKDILDSLDCDGAFIFCPFHHHLRIPLIQ